PPGVRHRSGEEFNVVAVCRANHCRSPLMEFLLRQQIELRNLNWTVISAGTNALPGQRIHPYAAELLAERGIETEGWVSRALDQRMLSEASLVLTATEEQRQLVESLDPYLIGRTFPLLQFAYLARSVRSARLLGAAELGPWLIQESYHRRKRLANFPEAQRDLEDPMGRTMNRFRQCAHLITDAYADVLACGPPVRWG
ncbi:MAG TPA: hypothetical protein VNT27_16720, partial [Propionibacteriaceae bacterium]|nr:hypothetical protein [Propionibacteriaceae bacterium]